MGNDVFTCGATLDSLGHYDVLVSKHNSSNVLQWSATFAGSYGGNDYASDIAIDGAGNVYVVGTKQVGANDYDAITIKYNASGVQQWVQTYTGAGGGPDGLTTIVLDGNNAVYVAGGMYQSITQLTNVLSIKYDSTGTALWTNTWNNGTYNMQDRDLE
ncbi:MAG: SBBP repeat-containing protein [Flavobacteriales bacterium]|nr:SBBP repeat-containing protein [Flavobacteriales bacterium]